MQSMPGYDNCLSPASVNEGKTEALKNDAHDQIDLAQKMRFFACLEQNHQGTSVVSMMVLGRLQFEQSTSPKHSQYCP